MIKKELLKIKGTSNAKRIYSRHIKIIVDYLGGKTVMEISKKYGMIHSRIVEILKDNKITLKTRKRMNKPEVDKLQQTIALYRNKVNSKKTKEIYYRHFNMIVSFLKGETLRDIGKQYKISHQAVQIILNRYKVTFETRQEMNTPRFKKLEKELNDYKKFFESKKYDERVFDWNTVDWTKSNTELKKKYNIVYSSVCDKRARFSPETCRNIKWDFKGSLLGLKDDEVLLPKTHIQCGGIRLAGYNLGWKIKQYKNSKGQLEVSIVSKG